jgi:hypothetical protein
LHKRTCQRESTFHTTLYYNKHRRINRLNIKIKDTDSKNKELKDEYVVIAIDSTGIKVTNRGQWMKEKWNVRNNKKGYLKIHIAVDVKTKKILSIRVTDEHIHDSKELPELVDKIIKSDDMTTTTIGKLLVLMELMMVTRFLDIWETMEYCHV